MQSEVQNTMKHMIYYPYFQRVTLDVTVQSLPDIDFCINISNSSVWSSDTVPSTEYFPTPQFARYTHTFSGNNVPDKTLIDK